MEDRLWGHPKILREVDQAFIDQPEGRVGVIIGVHWDHKSDELIDKLKAMGVKKAKKTDRYVWAKLTKEQVKKLAEEKAVFKIWHDRKMQGMYAVSSQTIKSAPALQLFEADGRGIKWAVLDTGIRHTHEYFSDPERKKKGETVVVRKVDYNYTDEKYADTVGHGTHVAGIIVKLAPKVTIYDFKVLGRDGGTSFGIIEAMYKIRKMNTDARKLIIHGVNLSLGGAVPVGSWGCGQSPECEEANRLADSGVVVCVAASNDGYKTLATISDEHQLEYFPTFMDMGISDPGNAEKVITVGSTHREFPHKYGISWFSSKGPTGDGRLKPDVVAPGERIWSAGSANDEVEVQLSGTSMATPHVSACIAQFLSVKPEFIEEPQKVKDLLMRSCTDLGRERYFQGAGLVDVLRMIQSV